MNYLKNRNSYEDRYDLHTIEQCLDQLEMITKIGKRMRLEPTIKDYPDSELERNMSLIRGRMVFLVKAQRYKNRAATIAEWMEADRAKQEKQDTAPLPSVQCSACHTQMVADDSRYLEDWPEDKPLRVLFFFTCPKCKKREGVYDNGEIRVSEPDLCPKCTQELVVKSSRKGKVITTLYTCNGCDYSKKDIYDLKKSDEEHKKWEAEQSKKNAADKQLLEKYRAEFCLSEKEGQEYVETLEALEVAHEVRAETLAELDTPAHEKLLAVNKISISELETLLNKALVKSGFTHLSFGTPDMDRHVLVPFTVQETKPKRRDIESISDLHNLFKTTLKDTNWRAPKDTFSYRLGFVMGKLRGYESEDELLKLFGKEEPKKLKSKLDPTLRAKYEHHNMVQLARMDAEYVAEKNIRTRRLKEEPDGFFLNDGGRGYTCAICRGHHDGEDIWWRPDGLRCRDCWRNIQEAVIPMLDLDKKWWEEEYFTKYEITDKRGVHSSSIRKLRREGILVGRDLQNSSGQIYWTIYLVSENKKFLEDYPRKSG